MSRVNLAKPVMPQAGPLPPIGLPRLRADQYAIAAHPAKVKVLMCGRRFGKSLLALVLAILTFLDGGKVAWVIPSYANADDFWSMIEAVLVPISKAYGFRIYRSTRTVKWDAKGAAIRMYSADRNAKAMRGSFFNLVIVDEAAQLDVDVWESVIYPTLADTDGEALLCSTPVGKNWFYQLYLRGQGVMKSPDDPLAQQLASWHAPTHANPSPNIQRFCKWAESNMTRRRYMQEILAMPQADGGEVFLNVREACTLKPKKEPNPDHYYVAGVDFGRKHDFTVISVFDVTTREQVYLEQFTGIEWSMQRAKIKDAFDHWQIGYGLGESNSVGAAVIEELIADGVAIEPFYMDYKKKRAVIENYTLAIEHNARDEKGCKLLADEDQIVQLEAYTFREMEGGKVKYGAPKGMHDDKVMAGGISWYALQQNSVEVATWDSEWD